MFRALRPINLLVIALVCLAFNFLSLELRETSLGSFSNFFLPYMICAVLIGASGYLINGYLDRDIDRLNHPEYNFPLSKFQTYLIYFVFIALASLIGLFSFSWKFNLAFLFFPILILWLYSAIFKRLPLLGNLTIAVISIWLPIGLLFLGHNLEDLKDDSVVANMTMTLLSEIFVITMAREIIKDIQDVEGDRQEGCKTLPVLLGEKFSALLSNVFVGMGGLILFNFIKTFFGQLSIINIAFGFLTLILLFISIALLWSNKKSWKNRAKHSSIILKVGMFTALLSFFVL